MRLFITILSIASILVACQPPEDNSGYDTFEKNSATVQAYLQDWENENVDYDKYFAENAWMTPTSFGSPDSVSVSQMKENEKKMWESLDFRIPQDIVFLPGVNNETKKVDGSVRYYGEWTFILPATDSTEEKSFTTLAYESYDFNEEGKIVLMQSYGDWGGIKEAMEDYMEGDDDDAEEGEEMEEADEEEMN